MAKTHRFFTCKKCGKPFSAWVGGFIQTKEDAGLMLYPVCDECKQKKPNTNK